VSGSPDDVAIVGGGLVGMATAYRLLAAGMRVTVFDKAPRLGAGQSGHNSNVIHSGAFYIPGSLKARLAARGREMLEEFIAQNDLPVARVGKLVVQKEGEDRLFAELVDRAAANGVESVVLGSATELHEFEPLTSGTAALWLPRVAVTDFLAVLETLAQKIREAGGRIGLGADVRMVGGSLSGDGYVRPRHVVVAAGTGFNSLCRDTKWRVVGFKGAYRELRSPRPNRLIYGVPDPRYPFLGVHVTPDVEGDVMVGPTATLHTPLAAGRTALLAVRNRRTAASEVSAWLSPRVMTRRVQRYVPEAVLGRHVVKAGIRAQAVDRRGNWADDFVFLQGPGVTFVVNAPSPGATACLAIGEHIAAQVMRDLQR
jgi:(S)-2-hydroxyglutarate dehydrogenase